jgi:hypothetical protein
VLDQCHNIETKIPAQIRSVMNVRKPGQGAPDTGALAAAQQVRTCPAPMPCSWTHTTPTRPLLAACAGLGLILTGRRLSPLGLRRKISPTRGRHPGQLGQLISTGFAAAWRVNFEGTQTKTVAG